MNFYTKPKIKIKYEYTETLFNLVYWINGRKFETIMSNRSKSLCKWKLKQLKESTHKMGLLTVEPVIPAEKRVKTIII
jgi:hypothetical protein